MALEAYFVASTPSMSPYSGEMTRSYSPARSRSYTASMGASSHCDTSSPSSAQKSSMNA